jgi:hypothetical protein
VAKGKKKVSLDIKKAMVVYHPNGQDLAIKPKNRSQLAVVVNEYEHSKQTGNPAEPEVKRNVVDLNVFSTAGVVVKFRVPEKKDARDGESYFEYLSDSGKLESEDSEKEAQ